MHALRWVEAASGVCAGVVGAASMIRLAPGHSHLIASSASCHTASQSSAPCVEVTGETITPTLVQAHCLSAVLLLSSILALLMAISCAAVWHSLTGRKAARGLLWSCADAFTLLAVWAMIGMGMDVFLAPSVALALVASLCALAVRGPVTI